MDRLPGGRPPGGPGAANPADLLRRRAIGAHAVAAPLAPPTAGGLGTLGEDEEEACSSAQAGSPATEAVPAGIFATPKPRGAVTLGNWATYWDRKVEVQPAGRGGTFNVYVAGDSGPVVMCIHGGGYSGLTWSLVAKKLKDKYRVVAPDMRGHGLTKTDNDTDFSRETMSEDIIAIWDHMFGAATATSSSVTAVNEGAAGITPSTSAPAASPAEAVAGGPGSPAVAAAADGPPAGVLVGHSMGGGLAVWAGAAKRIKRLEGVVVVDVVEGTALAALPHMMNVLAGRPTSFPSLEEAVTWAVRSGMSRNKEAAAVSMPGQLEQQHPQDEAGAGVGAGHGAGAGAGAGARWTWRTHLELSRPYWEGWYTGLSEAFLQLSCPKALVLAGTDRLDRALTIGQMQGKFQLILMPTAGHAIQEDEPDRTAEHLLGFLKRFRVGEPPLTFPRPPAGTKPVLPVVAGPVLEQK